MYGKTLADYPERFDEFLDEFKSADPERLDTAFRRARGGCKEFPTPADVRLLYNLLEPTKAELDRIEQKGRVMLNAYGNAPKYLPPSALDEPKPTPRPIQQPTEAEWAARLEQLRNQAFGFKK